MKAEREVLVILAPNRLQVAMRGLGLDVPCPLSMDKAWEHVWV